MNETLNVRIVVDSTQANSSFKQLNNQTGTLASNTNDSNVAMEQLNRTLNSLGFKAQRFSALKNLFGNTPLNIKKSANEIKNSFNGIGKNINAVKKDLKGFGSEFASSLKNINKLKAHGIDTSVFTTHD